MRKILIFSILLLLLSFAPRQANISQASDCFWVNQNNMWTCQPQNSTATPINYLQYYAPVVHQNSWGQIWQQGQLTQIGTQCLYSANLQWQTSGTSSIQVTVLDPDTGMEKLFSGNVSGQAQAPWISPGKNYRFTLWDTQNGQKNILSQVWVSGYGLQCGIPNGGQFFPGQPWQGGAVTITITSNNNFCVGQMPTYNISVPGWNNQNMVWASWWNNQQMGQTNVLLNANGSYSGSGSIWTIANIGHWKKTVSANGQSQTLEFDVRDCGPVNNNPYNPTPTYPITNPNPPYQNPGTGNISFFSNNNYCVGQTPTYTVQAGMWAANQMATWLSSGPHGANQTTITMDNSGNFSGSGNTWSTFDIGNWTKTVTILGVSRSINFSVSSCGNNGNQNNYNNYNNNTSNCLTGSSCPINLLHN